MQIPRIVLTFAAVLATLACSGPNSTEAITPANDSRADTLTAPYGEIGPRLTALAAMANLHAPLVLRMERFSVEGTKIIYYLAVESGRAAFTIDERADGGGIRRYDIGSLTLVRLEPSVWVDNVEVRKERFVPVDPANPGSAGPFLLVEPACLVGVCFIAF